MRDRGKSFHQPRSSAQCHLHSERATPRGTGVTVAPQVPKKLLLWKGEWTLERSFSLVTGCQDEVREEHLRAQRRGDPVRLHP